MDLPTETDMKKDLEIGMHLMRAALTLFDGSSLPAAGEWADEVEQRYFKGALPGLPSPALTRQGERRQ